MSTKILDSRREKSLQPAYNLWMRYQPEKARYAFRAKDLSGAHKWQVETRQALARAIGLYTMETPPLRPQKVEEMDKEDYVREKILLRISKHCLMPVYMLLPKQALRPLPVVLAFHGHGYGAKDIVGLWEDGQERDTPDGYQKDFAVALCKTGLAVAAPEIACFGERESDFSYLNTGIGQPVPTTCTHAAMLAFHLGISVMGLRVYDTMRLVEYLETRKDVDGKRLGAMGISGGGMLAFFSTCLDTRIRACVVSGYYSTFKDSILAMDHCACNYVPGLAQFGEMYDLVGLIAPRPILVEAGSHDPISPLKAVKKSVSKAKTIYEIFGVRQHVQADYFEGRHQISGQRAYEFLRANLG